jgi:hypothetical protein
LSGAAQAANHGADVVNIHHKTRCAIELVCVFKYPMTLVLHPAGFAASQRPMKVAGECGASDVGRVLEAETSASGDLNSSGSEFYQPCQPVSPRQNIAFPAGGEDASATCSDDVFKSPLKRHSVVECTMKGDFKWCSQIDELACAFHIHGAIGAKDTEDKAAGSERACVEEILAHESKLVLRIKEVAATRPQENMHGKAATLNRCVYKTVAWRESAFTEGGAEFDAVGSSFACGEAGLDTLCTEFEDNLAH